jgi:CRISPR-associated protein Csd1
MILNRLYELALREQLLAEPAFEQLPVPYVVQLGDGGKYLGIVEQRGEVVTVKNSKKVEEIKRTPDKGKPHSSPRPHGNTANPGFARYFVDTLPRVLPVEVEEKGRAKAERSRATFWQQLDNAADAISDPALRAVQAFGRQLTADTALAEMVRQDVAGQQPGAGDRVTFAYFPHGGPTILEWQPLRAWYSAFFKQFTAGKQEDGPVGFCTVTGTVGPLPTSHPIKLSGIPGGLPSGVSIVSFDKAAFQHYGLDGAANAAIGYEAADGYARAFQWLRGQKDHYLVVGGTLFLFWTRQPADTQFVMALSESSAEQVKALLENVKTGKGHDAIDEVNDFYLLAVSGNSARAIVRDYLERKLGDIRASIGKWFADLSIADPSKEHQGRPNAAFPLRLLSKATALDADRVAPDTNARLMHAALTGAALPDSILAAALDRLRAEGNDGFRAPRMALIKLILTRKEIPVTETQDPGERQAAYLYGRLLAVCVEIQRAALGDVNANIVDRFYGRFSTAPSFVLRRLVDGALDHLKKLRGGEKDWLAGILENRLTDVLKLVPAEPLSGQMSLVDQARFSIGFFHQKARTAEEIAERVRAKAAKTENK